MSTMHAQRSIATLALAIIVLCSGAGAAPALPQSLADIPYPLATVALAGSASVQRDALTIVANKGSDLFNDPIGTSAVDNTPRVLFQPAGDFILSAKVTPAFKREFDGGALIVYADKANWAKLLYENPRSGKPGVSTTVARGPGDDAHHGTREGGAVHLKVLRRGTMYVFYTSQDGQQWQLVRSFSLAGAGPVQVGFSAQSPVGEQMTTQFTDIRFRAAAFKDYWQGE